MYAKQASKFDCFTPKYKLLRKNYVSTNTFTSFFFVYFMTYIE